MLAVPVSSRLDEHKNPSNTSSEAGEEAKEQKVIELCRFSDTPLCQLYFELYSRIEALPAVVEQLDDPQGPVQLQSNYGHKIGSTPLLVHGTLGRDPSRTTPPAPQAIGLGKQIWMGNNTTTTTQGTKGPIVHLHLDDAVDFYNASSETLQANKSWTNTDLEGHGSRLSEVRVLPPEGFYFIDQDDPLLGGVGEETRTQNTRQIQRRMLGLGPRGKRKTSTKFSGLLQGKRASATSNDLDKSKAKPKDAQRRFGGFKKSREPNFPTYNSIPRTRFNCKHAPEGYHADPEAHCQVYHYCHYDGRQDSFLCPKGTIFNQEVLVCDWWYNSDCGDVSQALYHRAKPHSRPDYPATSHKIQFPTRPSYEPVALRGHHGGDDFDLSLLSSLKEVHGDPPAVTIGPIQAHLLDRPIARPFPTSLPAFGSSKLPRTLHTLDSSNTFPISGGGDEAFVSSFKRDIEESIAKIKTILQQKHLIETQGPPNDDYEDDYDVHNLNHPLFHPSSNGLHIGSNGLSDISVNTVESDYVDNDNEDIELSHNNEMTAEDYYYYDNGDEDEGVEDLASFYPDERSIKVGSKMDYIDGIQSLGPSNPRRTVDQGIYSKVGQRHQDTHQQTPSSIIPQGIRDQEHAPPPFPDIMSSPPKPAGFTSSDIESILSPMLNEIFQNHQHLVVDTRSQGNPSGEERPTDPASRSKTGFDALLATLKPQTRNKANASPRSAAAPPRETLMMTKKMVMDPVPGDRREKEVVVAAEESPGNGAEKNLPTSLSQLVGLTMDKIRRESNEATSRHATQPSEWLFTGDPSNVAQVLEPQTANLIAGAERENARLKALNESGGNRGSSLNPDENQMMPHDQQPRPPRQHEGGLYANLGQRHSKPQFNAKLPGTANTNGVSKSQNTVWQQLQHQQKQPLDRDQTKQLASHFPGSLRTKKASLPANSIVQKADPVPSTLELQKILLQHHKNQMLLKRQRQQNQRQQGNHQQLVAPPPIIQSRSHSNSAKLSFGQSPNQRTQSNHHPNNKGLMKNASAAGRGNNILSFSTSASIGVSSGQRRIGEAAEDVVPTGLADTSSSPRSQVDERTVNDWIPSHGYHPTVDIQETQKETLSQLQAHTSSTGALGAIHAKETFGTHQLVTLGEHCYLMSPSQELRLVGTKAECDLNDNQSQRLNPNGVEGKIYSGQPSSSSPKPSLTLRQPQAGPNTIDPQVYSQNRSQASHRVPKAPRPKQRPPPSQRRNKLSPKENAIWRTLKSLPVFKNLVQTIATSGERPSSN
ncbi:hypothetical protein TCAL_07924 [Tigriopus californicus]|uniref:Chitin-binding type-2 domain-containing protein n=1 Tax=Tigriopus californicus TaxID=6832 RepID=A0A553PGC2_TIGCA|nr:uncharacterized protein LOC131880706 [Tigriopus californicus]TRY76720.1 hypothetical protein TCAL_07924 [Tigriopus californicus]